MYDNCYRHSGKLPLTGMLIALLVDLVTAAALGVVYLHRRLRRRDLSELLGCLPIRIRNRQSGGMGAEIGHAQRKYFQRRPP